MSRSSDPQWYQRFLMAITRAFPLLFSPLLELGLRPARFGRSYPLFVVAGLGAQPAAQAHPRD
jgi:hypothetical protein